jgi:hypothetical protein
MILDGLAARCRDLARPDDGMHEDTYRRGEQAILTGHLREIGQATAALRAAWRRMVADLLALAFPGAAGRTTSIARLRHLELDLEEPDEFS